MELKNKDADTNSDVAYHTDPKIASKIYTLQKDLPEIVSHCKDFIIKCEDPIFLFKGKGELNFYFSILNMYNDTLGDVY
jgi:hypothetical protein